MNEPDGRPAVAPRSSPDTRNGPAARAGRLAAKLALPGLLLAAYLALPSFRAEVDRLIFILSMADVHVLRGWVEGMGALAPVASIGLMVFQAVVAPLPAVMVTFANAAAFGWIDGAILSWTGAMLGAAACYGIARYLGRDAAARLVPRGLIDRLDALAARWGAAAILVARLLPIVSFDAVSYAAGLIGIRFVPFLVATGIGQLPATVVYSAAGDLMAVDAGLLWGAVGFTAAAVALAVLIKILVKGRLSP